MSVIPMSRGPGYGAQAGQAIAAFDQNAAARLESILNARTASLGHILDNSERLANIGGSASIENLLGMYAGAQDRPLDPAYAPEADALRLATSRANLAAINRRGSGGSGGGNARNPNEGMFLVEIPGIGRQYVDAGDLDDIMAQQIGTSGERPRIVGLGAPVVDMQTNVAGPSANNGGSAVPSIQDNGDGTFTLSNGVRVDAEGNPL